jgi:ATP-dependent Clp protease ATP-binding subunit ClpC
MAGLPFTDRARKIIVLAKQQAERLRHEYVDSGHLLLGLIEEGNGVAVYVLKSLGVDLNNARRDVETLLSAAGPTDATPETSVFSPDGERVIEYAVEETRNLSHEYVGSEHILLALLRDRETISGQVLHNLGLDLPTVRAETLRILGARPAAGKHPLPEHISTGPVGLALFGLLRLWRHWR